MLERIELNEKRLDNIKESYIKLNDAFKEFKSLNKELSLLKRYYGSKSWFKDKEAYENKSIKQIKAGVLSEDEVWNLLTDIDDLLKEIQDYR